MPSEADAHPVELADTPPPWTPQRLRALAALCVRLAREELEAERRPAEAEAPADARAAG